MAGEALIKAVEQQETLDRLSAQIQPLIRDSSHRGGPLSEGKLDGDVVQCPWHGSRFKVRDGSVVDGPATLSAREDSPQCAI